ncbi:DUF6265 family protein [Spongiimicrobium salis]|uniref:DUF6265 family protein n=1 Tax=Spongiimicrobium salis TaxID=1667022 RepID=UPI00374D3711
MDKRVVLLVLCMLLWGQAALGQEVFPNTKRYDSIAGSPKAKIDAVAWIAGHWKGEAFGGDIEEVWTPPMGNAMMCVFKLVVQDEVQFYEILTIVEQEESLLLQLRHFNANLHAWEAKEETIDFKLVEVTDDKVYFNRFTFEREGTDTLNVYVVFTNEGKKTETKFTYQRVIPGS